MRSRAWRWSRGTTLESLGDPVLDAPIANVPLSEQQRRLMERAGFELGTTDDPSAIDDGEFLLFHDNVYISWPLLRRFLARARQEARSRPGCYRLALESSAFTAISAFTGEQPSARHDERDVVLYGVFWVRRVGEGVWPLLAAAIPLVLDVRGKEITIPFSSRIPTMPDQVVPITDHVVLELSSWVHLWLANLCAIVVALMEMARTPAWWPWLGWRALLALATARSAAPYRLSSSLARHVVRRGRRCRIHPSAVVEASILGDNVEIGPQCVVRGSILGHGVRVMEHSVVDLSILGDGVIINQSGIVKLALAYPEAVFTWIQTGVIGQRAFLAGSFRPLDMKFSGTVKVRHRGRLIDTGMPFLGCCIGHRVLVSGMTRLEPGRAIPNDYRILTDMKSIKDLAPGLPTDGFLVDRGGIVEPLRGKKPAH